MPRAHTLLVINPGSTSTKLAVYQEETPRLERDLHHDAAEPARFSRIVEQGPWRGEAISQALALWLKLGQLLVLPRVGSSSRRECAGLARWQRRVV